MKIIFKGEELLKGIELHLEANKMQCFLENRNLEGYIRNGDLIIDERSKADEGEN